MDSSVPKFTKIFTKIQDNFDLDGQLDSIAPPARSNPTARRGRNYLEVFKIFVNIGTELSTVLMGHSIKIDNHLNPLKVHEKDIEANSIG